MIKPKQILPIVMVVVCNIASMSPVWSQSNHHKNLRGTIGNLAKESSGTLGVSIRLLESGDTINFQDDRRYPMQSVFKFPIAICLLKAVELHRLNLDSSVFISRSDLRKTVSALLEKYPDGNVRVPVRELLSDMITLSDNNACDILIRLLGEPENITAMIHKMGVSDLNIVGNEAQMSADWSVQYKNWTRPSAQVSLLNLLYQNKLLEKPETDLLIHLMENTFVAPKRIRGLLPEKTVVAHRSGTSATNDKGLSPATNDIGVITLPGGKHLAIAIFLSDSYAKDDKRDEVIAKVARAAYDEFR